MKSHTPWNNPQEMFEEAVELFKSGKYDESLALLEQIKSDLSSNNNDNSSTTLKYSIDLYIHLINLHTISH